MKKVLIIILLVIIVCIGFNYSKKDNDMSIITNTEEYQVEITDYYIYGTHFNIFGIIELENIDNLTLVLKNEKEEIELNYELDNNSFYISDKINDGMYLDSLKEGSWYLLFKQVVEDKEYYYSLVNNTDYDDLEYYTITNNDKNNKIDIIVDNYKNKSYFKFVVKETKLPDDVYDITIDPGHGGNDSGAVFTYQEEEYYESNITLDIAKLLKKELETQGYKVLITRDDDILLDEYGDDGRAVLPNKYHTKLTYSLHLNSLEYLTSGGVEIYVPNDINISLAKDLADNIVSNTNVEYSNKRIEKLDDGVYYTYFDEEQVTNILSNSDYTYNIQVGAPEMYMIREVGGKMTKAYIDGSNERYGLNSYYDSNQTTEGYLLELAYLPFVSDLEQLLNNKQGFVNAIVDATNKYLQKK